MFESNIDPETHSLSIVFLLRSLYCILYAVERDSNIIMVLISVNVDNM